MADQWSLLRINPQSQSRYVGFVGEYYPDIEIYYPQYQRTTRPNKCRYPVKELRPVFPGYLFVRAGGNYLTRLPVRAYWVKFGEDVEIVSQRVIDRLRDLEMAGRLVEEIIHVNPYRSGVRVRIHLPVGDILAVIVKLQGGTRALVDLPVGKCVVPIHCLEVV